MGNEGQLIQVTICKFYHIKLEKSIPFRPFHKRSCSILLTQINNDDDPLDISVSELSEDSDNESNEYVAGNESDDDEAEQWDTIPMQEFTKEPEQRKSKMRTIIFVPRKSQEKN